MHEILDYCTGGTTRHISDGKVILQEKVARTGHLFILIEGRLEVIKGDSVVAVLTEPGAVLAKCRCCSTGRILPRSGLLRFGRLRVDDAIAFLREQPAVVLLIAQLLAQRLNVATTYLADLMHQYASHGGHLSMVGEILQTMINLPPTQVSPGSDRQSDPRL